MLASLACQPASPLNVHENWYMGVFGGEKNFGNGFEFLRAPEVATTVDDEKNHNQGIPLIAFSYVR